MRLELTPHHLAAMPQTELRLPELAAHLDDPAVRGAEAQYLHEMMEEADEDYPEIPVDFVESTREPHTGDMGADLGLDYLNCPRPVQQAMGDRNLWAVPPHLMLRHTVEEIHDACKVTGTAGWAGNAVHTLGTSCYSRSLSPSGRRG